MTKSQTLKHCVHWTCSMSHFPMGNWNLLTEHDNFHSSIQRDCFIFSCEFQISVGCLFSTKYLFVFFLFLRGKCEPRNLVRRYLARFAFLSVIACSRSPFSASFNGFNGDHALESDVGIACNVEQMEICWSFSGMSCNGVPYKRRGWTEDRGSVYLLD